MQVPLDLSSIPKTKYLVFANDQKIRIDNKGVRSLSWEWVDTSEEYLRYLQIIDALEINVISQYDDGDSEDLAFSWELVDF